MRLYIVINQDMADFYAHLAGKRPLLLEQIRNNQPLLKELGSYHAVIFIGFLKYRVLQRRNRWAKSTPSSHFNVRYNAVTGELVEWTV